MSFTRKALTVSTLGMSRVAGIKTNSKKERTAKALEKQNELIEKQIGIDEKSTVAGQATALSHAGSTASSASLADELTKLAALRDAGVISAEEFDEQKSILLSSRR
jgi:hypothetical protein